MRVDVLCDRYRILSPLGAGGMGEVFLADDTSLERRVAVKLLPGGTASDAVARERLRREALAAAALDHPFICKIHEIGDADGHLFIVMEYVEGETLHAAIRRDLLPLRQVIDIANELTEALEAAHRRNIIHRDLKPANVMVTPQGHVKVMDFGLAKQLAPPALAGDRTQAVLTQSGTRLGTPAYMSPEQVLGAALDPRSDIFSLGVILHELATGRHPFLRESPAETMTSILRDPPLAGSRNADDVPGLAAVIGRTLSKACAERHQNTAELLADLSALRGRAWSSSAAPVAKAPAQPAERTPFVGRDAEVVELSRSLDRMLTGQGGFVLIGGEPGVGKTRLVRELMAQARQRGCLCLTGHCYEMEGAAPFIPFVEITEQAVRLVPHGVRAAMGDFAAEIAAMAPSLRRMYSDIPPPPDVPADQLRRLIFGAFLEYIRRATQKSPGIFLFDDLHWADEPTLQLLLHVAPHLATMRVLAVGTYRDVELDVKRPFAKALESLLRQRLATRVSLRRLNESAVQHLLSVMGGSPAPSGLVTAVFRETEGNPFFIEEVYQHLCEEGKLFDASGAWKTDLRVDSIEVPEGVRLVIGRRLDRLGEHARKLLTAAAVIGRTFPLDVLQAIVESPEDEVLDALEEAERAQLIAADARQRAPRYGFVHELIRTTLISGLSLPRRQRLHLRIADVLERLRGAVLDSHASVLAHHLYQAGAAADASRTAKVLLLAARRALAAGAFEETLDTLENLLGLELPEQDRLVAQASEYRGEALAGLQRHDEATDAFDRALTIYQACRDDAGIERTARGAANCYVWRGQMSGGLAPLTRALAAISEDAARERGLLRAWLAVTQASGGRLEEGWASLDEADAVAGQLADPELQARVLIGRSICSRLCCDFDQASASARQALAMIRDEALWDRTDLLVSLLYSEYILGRLTVCDALAKEVDAAGKRAGHHGAIWMLERVRGNMDVLRTGDIRAFLAQSRLSLHKARFQFITRTSVGQSHLYLGEGDRALDELQRAVDEQPAEHSFRGMPEGNLLAAAALVGENARAEALVPRVIAALPKPGRFNSHGAYYALDTLITGLTLIGDRERCAAMYPLTQEYLRTGAAIANLTVGPTCPQLTAALAADAAGLIDQSHVHFETALRQARDVPMRLVQPMILYWYGRTLSSAGTPDRERGRAMAAAAAVDFRVLDMPLHAGLAERVLQPIF